MNLRQWTFDDRAARTQSFKKLIHTTRLGLRVRIQILGHSDLKQAWGREVPHYIFTLAKFTFSSYETWFIVLVFVDTKIHLLNRVFQMLCFDVSACCDSFNLSRVSGFIWSNYRLAFIHLTDCYGEASDLFLTSVLLMMFNMLLTNITGCIQTTLQTSSTDFKSRLAANQEHTGQFLLFAKIKHFPISYFLLIYALTLFA